MDVICELCPKRCRIPPGRAGDCRIRVNLDGKLRAVTYGYPCSVHVDPIEKKPLYHFLPGSRIFSLATVGCNLHCLNCQNWEISQRDPGEVEAGALPPARVVDMAKAEGCPSIAYTYTDPVVWYEYAFDSCRAAREAGLRNVLVTAGYINPGPLRELCRFVDGANIDLKAFSDKFYRDICSATLAPVLDALVLAKSLGVRVEVTNLVIPALNDQDVQLRDLARWVAGSMGKETPLHFSGFHPRHKLKNLPPTPGATLERAREIARAEGLHYVYVGNVMSPEGNFTRCPKCGKLLIERAGFRILQNRLDQGRCPDCREEVYGVWS